MTEIKCGFCRRDREVVDVCGPLWQATISRGEVAAHHKCMQYSSNLVQYKTKTFGGFKAHKVLEEIARGKKMKCSICKIRLGKKGKNITGATAGCAIQKCRKTFHFYCAATDNEAMAKRMVICEDSGKKHVEYRVFCGPQHHRLYERSVPMDAIQYVSNSEDSNSDVCGDTDSRSPRNPTEYKANIEADFESESRSSSSDDDDDSKHPPKAKKRRKDRHRGDCSPGSTSKRRSPSSSSDSGHENKTPHRPHSSGPVAPSSSGLTNSGAGSSGGKGNLSNQGSSHHSHSHVLNGNMGRMIGSLVPVKTDDADMGHFYENNNIATSCHGQAHVVCLILSEVNCTNADINNFLQVKVKELYRVETQFVHSVTFSKWSPIQKLCYARDVTKKLREGDLAALKSLVTLCPEGQLPEYQTQSPTDPDLSEQDYSREIQGEVQLNFVAAKETYGAEVGRFRREKAFHKVSVAYLVVCDAVDPSWDIRAALTQPNRLYKWGQATRLLEINALSSGAQVQFQQCEEKALSKWLLKHSSFTVPPRWPHDDLLLPDSISPDSVCNKLYQQFCSEVRSNGDASTGQLVFIGPLDHKLVQYKAYVNKCIDYLVSQKLTDSCKLFCVFEIGCDMGICSTMDMVSTVPQNTVVKVWSGLDPESCPVTCVVLELEVSA